jgi:TolB protein
MQKPLALVMTVLSATLIARVPAAFDGDIVAMPMQDPQTTQQQQQRQELVLETLRAAASHPKIGVPDFAKTGGNVNDAAPVLADVLWADLDYEREYYMISRKSSASIPAATSALALPFDRWTEIGADFVLMGSVRESAGKMTVEVRLIAVRGDKAGTQAFGQIYDGCSTTNPRFCAHSIADDMHLKLRNLMGVARTRIAFTSDRTAENSEGRPLANSGASKEIHIMDYDGETVRRITVNRSLNLGPSWGPDGRTLAYSSYADLYPDIYVVTLDGRPPSRPTKGTDIVHNQSPAISPDGNRIAFVSNRVAQGNRDIWVVNRDGSNLMNLTPNTPKSMEGAPTWSPGGNQIAFTSDRTGVNQIYLMEADGTGVQRLTFDAHVDRPTWSRLDYIAYTLVQPAGHDIAVLTLANPTPRVITDGLGSNKQPSVAPNGRHIVFVTTRWGKEHLASIDLDGKNIRQLTQVGNNTYPAWSPSPGGR